jgi:hypothetical protein
MIGDQGDILNRLKAALPPWFGTNTPIMDAVLSGPSSVLSGIYSLIKYATLQTRIGTATDGWLDLIARDFFARGFQRRLNEPDAAYQARILAEIVRPRVTRAAISKAMLDLTGTAPIIFEPARVFDTGAFGTSPPTFVCGGAGLPDTGLTGDSTIITADSTIVTADAGQIPFTGIGAWGSLSFPNQFFITAFRPPGASIPNVGGFCSYANPTAGGGYSFDSGFMEWITIADIQGGVTDADIYATIARNIAAGVTAWTKIIPFSGLTPANLTEWQPVFPDDVAPVGAGDYQSIAFVEAAPF